MSPAKLGDDLLTMQQTAELLHTTRPTLNRWLREGRLSGVKMGRQWRFQRTEVERFLEGSPTRASLPTDPAPLLGALRALVVGADEAKEDPVADAFSLMVQLAVHREASSFCLEASLGDDGSRTGTLRYRVDGVWELVCQFDARLVPPLIEQWKRAAACDVREESNPQDGRILMTTGPDEEPRLIDLRVAFLPCMFGESMTVRLLDQHRSRWRLDQLDLPQREQRLLRAALHSRGRLVAVAGLTGSARLTVLTAALREVSAPERKLMTIEGPAWPLLPWATQISRRQGQSVSYAVALGTVLRSDPDIVGVESVTDSQTLTAVQDACRQGALVVAGVSADSSLDALRGLVDLAGGILVPELELIVAQRLLRKLCPNCSVPQELTKQQKTSLDRLIGGGQEARSLPTFRQPVGCPACANTGYRKQVMVAEAMRITPALRSLIRDGAADEALLEAAVADGMVSLDAQSAALAWSGVIPYQEIHGWEEL